MTRIPERSRPWVRPGLAARAIAMAVVVALAAGCESPRPSPAPTPTGPPSGSPQPSGASPTPTALPSPTAAAGEPFPLAVVTGLTNLTSVISEAELGASTSLVVPCGVSVAHPALTTTAACIDAERIASAIEADQELVALLPPGLVEPATKVLPIAGDGPFGLFGPDLFGDTVARAMPYPIMGVATGAPVLEPAWTAYDPSQIWTMTNVGSLCSDRYAAREVVTNGRGWHWVFNGGTAEYRRPPRLNPNPPPGIDQNLFVEPVATGNDGSVGQVQRRADVAIADHECPIVPTAAWRPNTFVGLTFSVPEAVLPEWKDTLGLDVAYLAANHMSDRGVAGIRSTLRLLDEHGIGRTGMGMDLDGALEPAYVEVAGIKVGFVAFNDIGGVAKADADTAGVAWITRPNIRQAVRRAREGGADVVVCSPQWGVEYLNDLTRRQHQQIAWFDEAGCDQVIGSGAHLVSPMLLREPQAGAVKMVFSCPGNYVFGQDFFQDLQEGVILEQKYVGTRLVNFRLHPYVIIRGARPALTDPEGDGHYVLERIWRNSDLDYSA